MSSHSECYKEIKYNSYIEANNALKRAKKSVDNIPGAYLNPYHCRECGYWHLGTTVKTGKYKRNKRRDNV